MAEWIIEAWDKKQHDRADFSCGQASLDDFLHLQINQYEKRRLGKTFVAVRPGENKVLGYYTISSSSVRFADLPAAAAKKLPKHPVPVVLLGRLAVDVSMKGQGLGADLLVDALHRVLHLSATLGIHAVEVHALDATARAFYERFGFQALHKTTNCTFTCLWRRLKRACSQARAGAKSGNHFFFSSLTNGESGSPGCARCNISV